MPYIVNNIKMTFFIFLPANLHRDSVTIHLENGDRGCHSCQSLLVCLTEEIHIGLQQNEGKEIILSRSKQ